MNKLKNLVKKFVRKVKSVLGLNRKARKTDDAGE